MAFMQWIYFDSLECLPEEEKDFLKNSYQKVNTRYDGQIAVFGQDFQRYILSRKFFIVGCGAIVCEILKNFTMKGKH